ncbi:hypothetical protein ABEG63_13805 [Chryseobacterium sp. C39-AII1]|uniref:hypothetical protein n=1 Tax=Chryseobacterium sp. C39-AII1 TaxID=3080332 RepID=UPI00320A4BDA
MDWFEKANHDTTSVDGLKNIFYMSTLVGHEINHWGESAGTRVRFEKTSLGSLGYNDAGDYFENKLLKDTYYKRGIGDPGKFTTAFDIYIWKKTLNYY